MFEALFSIDAFLRQLNWVFNHNLIIGKTEKGKGFVLAADLSGVLGETTVWINYEKISNINFKRSYKAVEILVRNQTNGIWRCWIFLNMRNVFDEIVVILGGGEGEDKFLVPILQNIPHSTFVQNLSHGCCHVQTSSYQPKRYKETYNFSWTMFSIHLRNMFSVTQWSPLR